MYKTFMTFRIICGLTLCQHLNLVVVIFITNKHVQFLMLPANVNSPDDV